VEVELGKTIAYVAETEEELARIDEGAAEEKAAAPPAGAGERKATRKAVELAERHGFWIFEDDPYREVRFAGSEEVPTMLSIAEGTGAQVVHASSFSKTVSPGVRVGYLIGPAEQIAALAQRANETYISPNMLAESIVYELCRSGGLDANIDFVNVALAGTLTGLVYGLMALGLSVIFGVVRVVNFAHGEMMTIAMYAAVLLFAHWNVDPFVAVLPIAAAFFALGYALQSGLINPFITRPEHSQFMLLVAVAIIMVNGLLVGFGPDARSVQVEYQLESWALGPILFDKARVYAAAMALLTSAALFAFFRFTLAGKAIRACADNYLGARVVGLNVHRYYALTFGLGSACVAIAGCMMVVLVDVTPVLGPGFTLLAFVIVVGAVWGDLFSSALKREANVKDAGTWLPGFGGLLDRIDSFILAVPLVYYAIALGDFFAITVTKP